MSYTIHTAKAHCIGIDVRWAAILQNIHGYVAAENIFEESIFMQLADRASIVNAYPDTQAKFFNILTS